MAIYMSLGRSCAQRSALLSNEARSLLSIAPSHHRISMVMVCRDRIEIGKVVYVMAKWRVFPIIRASLCAITLSKAAEENAKRPYQAYQRGVRFLPDVFCIPKNKMLHFIVAKKLMLVTYEASYASSNNVFNIRRAVRSLRASPINDA